MTKRKSSELFEEFCKTIAALRHPETGCPWDLKQTHQTLRKYMLEEAYEAANEMNGVESTPALCDELGDVLLQVVLNSQIAKDQGKFEIGDVIENINSKMLRRHPHVFDDNHEDRDEKSIKDNWERIKKEVLDG